ncbi:50S ribosomal protein L35 [Calderihabitans maritimus]|uniref:Large ribosomal subunit protein bL35 n=1 Tax=Calderihabitans maritimus TaxID=1246530 RepID=A0A1Z5HSI3_9FIRM|nr:50S ribosomal protein L35 [Calderihabitans maritimus]GAW92291.1 50S ribosomal protein L35 [Calderihabitans maritimus]
MPKMKTHRGAAKRFKLTGKGKVKRAKAFKSHLLEKKSAKRKRKLRQGGLVSAADRRRIRKLLPYA